MPQARTRASTCPGPGRGRSISSMASVLPRKTMARMGDASRNALRPPLTGVQLRICQAQVGSPLQIEMRTDDLRYGGTFHGNGFERGRHAGRRSAMAQRSVAELVDDLKAGR